jgi:hypothetical protein
LTSIYFCKLCEFEARRERDISYHLLSEHGDELFGIFEMDDDAFVMIPAG